MGPGSPAFQRDFYAKLITRNYRTAKSGPLDTSEHDELAAAVLDFGEQERAASLRDGFHDQYARHDRQVGEVSGKERFVDGYILDGHNPLLALDLNHTVDQQKGKTVGQDAEDVDDVQRCLVRRRGRGCRVSGVGHFLLPGFSRQERRLYCNAT